MAEKGTRNVGVKRSRRRGQLSCTFCKKRKLKCNQTRPVCGQCKKRGLQLCVYPRDTPLPIPSEELYSKFPNLKLAQRVSQLETEARLRELSYSTDTVDSPPRLKRYFDSGTGSIYGPSSLKCISNTKVGSRQDFSMKLSQKVMQKYERTCVSHQYAPVSHIAGYDRGLPKDVEAMLCADVPCVEWIERRVAAFFNSSLYEIIGVIDEKRTLRDLHQMFLIDSNNEDGNKSRGIVGINLEGNNIFSVGIVLMTVLLSPGESDIYPGLQNCIQYITSICLLATRYVERSQFLILAIIGKLCDPSTSCNNYDDTRLLVNHLCNCCVILDLQNVDSIYLEGYSSFERDALKQTFYWTLLLDVRASLKFGAPITITDDNLDVDSIFRDVPSPLNNVNTRRSNLMKRFLKLSRSIISSFNRIGGMRLSQVVTSLDMLSEFMKSNLLPIRFYLEVQEGLLFDMFDFIVLGTVLEISLVLSHTRQLYFNDKSECINKDIVKFASVLGELALNNIIVSHNQDEHSYPKLFQRTDSVTPHLQLSIVVGHEFLIRSLTHLYKYAFDGWWIQTGTSQDMVAVFDSEEIESNVEEMHMLFEGLFHDKYPSLKGHLKHSGIFVSIALLENVFYSSWSIAKKNVHLTSYDESRHVLNDAFENFDSDHILKTVLARF
ncbi:hypothetical protein DAKH74_043320 [Maudiozyma humilis]|uniref:Zn(2)-C6 fungal-type domain-containing protein n=1 Tax=Maudiozyma humilis TaxID=51915 RepID=A0AAV5S3V1_MAUHU|nr:hypothetical protein DAKH74_043320 [Kazachstania humilis]